jgi:hypothetical protein
LREVVQHLAGAKQMNLGSVIVLDSEKLEQKVSEKDKDELDDLDVIYGSIS